MEVDNEPNDPPVRVLPESNEGREISTSGGQLTLGQPTSPSQNDAKRKRASAEPPTEPDPSQLDNDNGEQTERVTGSGKKGLDQEPEPKRARTTTSDANSVHESSTLFSAPPKLHGLTSHLWKKIFSLLPPVFLGRLLRVSRDFNSLLTPGAAAEDGWGSVEPSSGQSVWLASRQRYAAGLPQALPGQSELEMWRLIRGRSCQLCKKQKSLITSNSLSDPWHPPSGDGMRVIWAFKVRCCPQCLRDHIEQESSLLFSSSIPSFLLPTLPYIFLTEGNHYVHSHTVKHSTHPRDLSLSKAYYKPIIEEMNRYFQRVKAEDADAAKAWVGKLRNENDIRADCVLTWEQWETKGGLKRVNVRPGARPSSAAKLAGGASLPQAPKSTGNASSQSSELAPAPSDVSNILTVRDSNGLMYSSLAQDTTYHSATLSPESLPPQSNDLSTPYSNYSNLHNPSEYTNTPGYSHQLGHLNPPGYRPERNLKDVTEAKAERKAEIERRCVELRPPIPPNILCHMDSFQAALQIPQPLTEQAWDLLLPRLLDQREDAEKVEHERLAREKAVEDMARERAQRIAQQTAPPKEDPEAKDHTWDASQAPIRDRLSLYADEQIRNRWSNGAAVNKETSPAFAADVLLYVKRRFDEDHQQSASAAAPSSVDSASANAPDEDTLILENMKWLFDNKIRPLTEPYQREIFLCSICEGASKYYGFEAVIQHYAAKHTTALSQGSVVVHWRAKWPDQPPFHPNPGLAKSSYPSSASIGYAPHGVAPVSAPYSVSQIAPFLEHAAPWIQSSPGGYTPLQPEPAFTAYQPPPQPSPLAPPYPNNYPSMPTSSGPLSNPYHQPNQGIPYGTSAIQPVHPHGQWLQHPSPKPPDPQVSDPNIQMYLAQMNEDMAKHAREVWFAAAGVRDMPASVRIYVVIQHVAMRLADCYPYDFTLAMFLDGLNHNSQMRPVRSLNGLVCRTCTARGMQNGHSNFQHGRGAGSERKQYTLPLLLNHFKAVHLENTQPLYGGPSPQQTTQFDWKRDMIELPEPSVILSLINAQGMDNGKLSLIAQVFPGVFPNPLPKAGTFKVATPSTQFSPASFDPPNEPVIASSDSYRGTQRSSVSRGRVSPIRSNDSRSERRSHSSTRDWQPAGEDEYDPHRPAYLGRMVDSRRASQPDRGSPITGNYPEANPDDYDPNQPIIDYNDSHRSSRPYHRPPKIEVVEAEQFLDQLKPQLDQSRNRYPAENPNSAPYDKPYPQSNASHHSGEERAYDSRTEYACRDPHEPPRSARYYEQVWEQHTRRSPRERSDGGRRYGETITYVSPSAEIPSPYGREIQREPLSQPAVRYIADSHPSGYYSPREAQVQYVYPPSAPYGPESERHPGDRPRAVEYVSVDDYRRDHRYTQTSPMGPSSARAYVVEGEGDAYRPRNEGIPYEDITYSSRQVRPDPDGGIIYREYR